MNKNRKRLFIILGSCLFALALIYITFWYFLSFKRYAEYEKDFPQAADPSVKILEDAEGYQYSVKQPSIIEFYSNLGIISADENTSLVIWPDVFDKEEFEMGIILSTEEESTQIMLKDAAHAEDEANQYIVDENQVEIQKLVDKANEVWNLGLE